MTSACFKTFIFFLSNIKQLTLLGRGPGQRALESPPVSEVPVARCFLVRDFFLHLQRFAVHAPNLQSSSPARPGQLTEGASQWPYLVLPTLELAQNNS